MIMTPRSERNLKYKRMHLDHMPMRKCFSGQEAKFYNSRKVISVQLIIGHHLLSLFH